MQCRRCRAPTSDAPSPWEPARSRHHWGADRISGLRCGRCGVLLDAEDIAQLLEDKESQLARFGLLSGSYESHAAASAARRGTRVVRFWKD